MNSLDSRLLGAQRSLMVILVCFVVLAIFPLTPEPTNDIKILGYQLFAFAGLTLWVFTPRLTRQSIRHSSALLPLLLVFLGLCLVAALLSPNLGYSVAREFARWAALSIILAVSADAFHTPEQVWRLIGAICIAVSVASLYGFLQLLGLDPLPWGDDRGMLREGAATFGNPNLASHVLVGVVVLGVGVATVPKRRWALLCVLLFCCHFALTRTRGSLLALAGASLLVIAALLVSRKVRKPSQAICMTLGVVVLAGLVSVAGVAGFSTMKTGEPYPSEDNSILLRYNSFYGACLLVQDNPWLGHGLGMYRVAAPTYWTDFEKDAVNRTYRVNEHVHNEPLEFAVDVGLPAAIAYIAILVLGIYYGLSLGVAQGDPERRSLGFTLAAFFFAFLLDGLFGFNAHAPASAVLLFMLLGATAGLWRERHLTCTRYPSDYGWLSLCWRWAVLACAALIPISGIRDFTGEFYQQRGHGAMYYKAYPAAAECFRAAVSLAPYDWGHHTGLGHALMAMGDDEGAVRHFTRALELNPNGIGILRDMGQVKVNLAASNSGDKAQSLLQEASFAAQRAIQLNPLLPESYDILGRVSLLRAEWLAKTGGGERNGAAVDNWREAERNFLKAIQCGSKAPGTLYRLLATARAARGDASGAQKALISALEEEPGSLQTWQQLWQISRDAGRYDALLLSLERRIQSLGDSPNASEELVFLHALRAKVLFEGYGDKSGAEEAFLQGVEKYPKAGEIWAAFYRFAISAGRREVFETCLLDASSRFGDKKEALPLQVQAVIVGLGQGENRIVAAVSTLTKALAAHQAEAASPDKTAAQFAWAAEELAEQARKSDLSPEQVGPVFLNLGMIHGACQDYAAAAQLLDEALPYLSGGQRLLCLQKKASALDLMGETDAALKTYEQAATMAPENLEARFAFAQALARGKQHAKAATEYQKILQEFEMNAETRRRIQAELDALSE